MKKIFIAMMAMAAFAACATEDTIVTPKGNAIAFGDAFVDNSTKAIIEDADDIEGFTVWGNVQGTGSVVALYGDTGATVTRENGQSLGDAWNCSVVRYWTPSCQYNFVAIANGTVAVEDGKPCITNGIPTKINYSVGAYPVDLLYGEATAETDSSSVPTGSVVNSGSETANIVKFTMNHLLSRVKVSFQNMLDQNASDYKYSISDVKVVSAGSGTYTIAEDDWELGADTNIAYSGTSPIANGSTESYGAALVIPSSPVKLVFTYELKLQTSPGNWETINTQPVEKVVVATPVKNYSYNITVQLKAGAKIDFTVDSTNGLVDFAADNNINM